MSLDGFSTNVVLGYRRVCNKYRLMNSNLISLLSLLHYFTTLPSKAQFDFYDPILYVIWQYVYLLFNKYNQSKI